MRRTLFSEKQILTNPQMNTAIQLILFPFIENPVQLQSLIIYLPVWINGFLEISLPE